MVLSRRGMLRLLGVTTTSLVVPGLWMPPVKKVEAALLPLADFLKVGQFIAEDDLWDSEIGQAVMEAAADAFVRNLYAEC